VYGHDCGSDYNVIGGSIGFSRLWLLGSLNGTYVNREPVESAVLANGDEIQIGKFCLVFLTRPTTD